MFTPALNPLVLSLKESATLAINLKAIGLREAGKTVHHFGFGQSPFPVPDNIQEALRKNADKKEYLPTQGLPELCEAVAAFYRDRFGYNFSAENVCIGPGSKELNFQTLYLMEGPLLVHDQCIGPSQVGRVVDRDAETFGQRLRVEGWRRPVGKRITRLMKQLFHLRRDGLTIAWPDLLGNGEQRSPFQGKVPGLAVRCSECHLTTLRIVS